MAVRESWTDERLDDFRKETGRRFDTIERRMDEGFREVNSRIDGLQRTMIQTNAVIVAALIGLIATQL